MAWTQATDPKLFFSRQDPQDPRLGEWAQSLPLSSDKDLEKITEPSWILLGYPDDEGIQLNSGRVGAKEAPNQVRTPFYKMTPSLQNAKKFSLVDLGNLDTSVALAERHERGRQIIAHALKLGHKTVGLGGGHDYGYTDGAGFLDFCAQTPHERPLVINFDAHLDVRPTTKGLNSGTPFYRLLTQYPHQFDFVEVGIQNQCNSLEHKNWVEDRGGKVLLLSDIRKTSLLQSLETHVGSGKGRPCFLSIDIDAFTSSEAPGCSQSWATGLHIQEFLPALEWLLQNFRVLSTGIYEVSPPLDPDHRTSKLAALILHHIVFNK